VEYLQRHPTAADILAAVHKVKPRRITAPPKKKGLTYEVNEKEFEKEFHTPEVLAVNDGMAEKPDEEFLESIRWAKEKKKNLKLN
jgi:hypothetical protein